MFHFGHALQALGDLMEAAHAAVQFQAGLLADFVEKVLTDGPTSVVRDIAAASLGFFASLQAIEELGFVAQPTVLDQIICGA